MNLKIILSELQEKSFLLENLGSLAYYLAVMKVTTISKDFATTRRILSKFLKNKETQMSRMISEVQSFDKKTIQLECDFKKLLTKVAKEHMLEDKLEADTDLEFNKLKKLREIGSQQKVLMYNIGITFSDLLKQLMKDKGFARR